MDFYEHMGYADSPKRSMHTQWWFDSASLKLLQKAIKKVNNKKFSKNILNHSIDLDLNER